MSQTYTFQELVEWKARSTDKNEQKKIRRLIRELRATDPSVPSLRRGISRTSGIVQPSVDVANFNPADKSTWPTTGSCKKCHHRHKKVCKAQVRETVTINKTREVIRDRECSCDVYVPDYDPAMWTEDMHAQFIDWMAKEKPLHVVSYVNAAGVPVMGCDASCCSAKNWAIYDQLVADAEAELERTRPKKNKLKKAAKKAAKKMKVTKVSSV